MTFLVYAIDYVDRTNTDAVLPFIINEFHTNNFEVWTIVSMSFLGYAVSQIPTGFFVAKRSARGLVSLSIFGFSAFTWLMDAVGSVFGPKLMRLGLRLNEGPRPVGLASIINNQFLLKKKATMADVYIAATMFALTTVLSLAVWITIIWGWRWIFFSFVMPEIVVAIAWYPLVKSKLLESGFVLQNELVKISARCESRNNSIRENILITDQFTWLDKIIRVKKITPTDTAKGLSISKNILGGCLTYFMVANVLYGLLTRVPLYLVKERGFDVISMGFVASMPYVDDFIGATGGGRISGKVLGYRRKSIMAFTVVSTVVMMLVMPNIPTDILTACIRSFSVGFCSNIDWPAFTVYGMAVSDSRTYPIASPIINGDGNFGGFAVPMAAGFLLDKTGSFDSVFIYFGIRATISLVVTLFLNEPQ